MSNPSSMNVGPFTTTVLVKKKYLGFYVGLMWISITAITLEFWIYWQYLWNSNSKIVFFIFLPLLFFLMYITTIFVSLFLAKVMLIIINFLHKPREGIFLRDNSDRDYRFWSLRNVIKKWPIWLSHKFPVPFLDNICFKVFGVKTKFSNSLFEGWVDCEFIEFGKGVIIGKSSIIQSSLIVGSNLIIKKTIIGDNAHIGAHTVVMPGTHIGKNCILAASSATTVDQYLEPNWIYIGLPAKKYRKNPFFEENLENKITHVIDTDALQAEIFKTYEKGKHN